jgi:hypothetical protein
VTLARPYYYWNEVRRALTSNTQFQAVTPTFGRVPALRRDDDLYVRSIWHARLSYVSDLSNPVVGWWGQAQVRLVVSWDPENLNTPSDIGDDDPLTLGFMGLNPRYSVWPDASAYQVDFDMDGSQLILDTSRLGDGVGVLPGLLYSMYYYDQNGFFSGVAEPSSIRRLQVTGRVLWASSQAP